MRPRRSSVFPINPHSSIPEQTLVVRNRSSTYNMVLNVIISVEFPSNAVNGFEITTHSTASNPTNYTSRSHNGTSCNASTAEPPCIIIKGGT